MPGEKEHVLILNVPKHEYSRITETSQKGDSSEIKQQNVYQCFCKTCTCITIIHFLDEDLAQF